MSCGIGAGEDDGQRRRGGVAVVVILTLALALAQGKVHADDGIPGAFAVLLFGVGLSGSLVEFLADRFLSEEAMALPVVEVPAGASATAPLAVEEGLQLDAPFRRSWPTSYSRSSVMIGVGVALFTVAVTTGAFDAQPDNILGNSLAVSRGYLP